QAEWIQRLGDRLLTEADASQLLESILAAICDNLRVPTAFVARIDAEGAHLVQVAGSLVPSPEALTAPELSTLGADPGEQPSQNIKRVGDIFVWRSYWLVILHYNRRAQNGLTVPVLGILGVWARAPEPDFSEDEEALFHALA